MNYPLRTIAFWADLIHPPMQHSPEVLQKIHSVIFNDAECKYQNFQLIPGGAQLINPSSRPGVVSACTILGDRVQVREELTGIGRDDFGSRVKRMAKVAVTNLGIPLFIMRQFVIRSLINPKNSTDSREFLAGSVLKMKSDDFKPLEKDPNLVGVRFAFHSASPEEGVYNLRVESYTKDTRSLFLENVANYRRPLPAQQLDEIGDDFDDAYMYIENRLIPFIANFDQAP